MALVTGTLYAKKSYGRSLFGELVSPTVPHVEAEKVENKSKEEKDNTSTSTGEILTKPEEPETGGNNPEVKVQWKTVNSGGSKQKELGKGFFTPKTYESEEGDSEQEDTEDRKAKSGAKKSTSTAATKSGTSALHKDQSTSRINQRQKNKSATPRVSTFAKKDAQHKKLNSDNSNQKKKPNTTDSKSQNNKTNQPETNKVEDSTELSDGEDLSSEEDEKETPENKPYVIRPISVGRYSEVLETIPEDTTLDNIIDEEDLADIKRDLALKGIIPECESDISKPSKLMQEDVATKPEENVASEPKATKVNNLEAKTVEHETSKAHNTPNTTIRNDRPPPPQRIEREFVYPNLQQHQKEVIALVDDERNEGFKTNKSFEIRRLQAKQEREKEEKKRSWFKPKFFRSKVSAEPAHLGDKHIKNSSYREKQGDDHRKNWIRKKPKSILTSSKNDGTKRLLQNSAKTDKSRRSTGQPVDSGREPYSRSSSVMGNRADSAAMEWDSESLSSLGDDISIGGEYSDEEFPDNWEGNHSPLDEEDIHQLYEDIDRLDPSRMASFNPIAEEAPPASRAASAAAFSTTGRSSYHVMNDPNFYIKAQRDNLRSLRPGSRGSPVRYTSAMSSTENIPLHLFDSMRYEHENGGVAYRRQRSGRLTRNSTPTGKPTHESPTRKPALFNHKRGELSRETKKSKKKVRITPSSGKVANGSLFRNGSVSFGSSVYPIPDRKMTPMSQKEWEAEVRKIHGSPYYRASHERKSFWQRFFSKHNKNKKKPRHRRLKQRVAIDEEGLILPPLCYNKRICYFCDCMDCSNAGVFSHSVRVFFSTCVFVILMLMVVFLSTGIIPFTLSSNSTLDDFTTTTPLTTTHPTTTMAPVTTTTKVSTVSTTPMITTSNLLTSTLKLVTTLSATAGTTMKPFEATTTVASVVTTAATTTTIAPTLPATTEVVTATVPTVETTAIPTTVAAKTTVKIITTVSPATATSPQVTSLAPGATTAPPDATTTPASIVTTVPPSATTTTPPSAITTVAALAITTPVVGMTTPTPTTTTAALVPMSTASILTTPEIVTPEAPVVTTTAAAVVNTAPVSTAAALTTFSTTPVLPGATAIPPSEVFVG